MEMLEVATKYGEARGGWCSRVVRRTCKEFFLGMWCMQWERDFIFGSSMTLGVILIL